MPETDGDCNDLIGECSNGQNAVCYIEKVGGYIAGNKCPGSAMFNFGHGRGVLIGCLLARCLRIIEPTPQQWQKWLQIGTIGGDKNKLKAEAQRRFPRLKVTLKTADALLMLDYAIAKEGSE
jgi:hypothetical protein